MEDSLYILIPISILLVFAIAGIFWWSVKSGQFEDMQGPAWRVMMDDDKSPPVDHASAQHAGDRHANRAAEQEAAADLAHDKHD